MVAVCASSSQIVRRDLALHARDRSERKTGASNRVSGSIDSRVTHALQGSMHRQVGLDRVLLPSCPCMDEKVVTASLNCVPVVRSSSPAIPKGACLAPVAITT
jgi:hypothetical protein